MSERGREEEVEQELQGARREQARARPAETYPSHHNRYTVRSIARQNNTVSPRTPIIYFAIIIIFSYSIQGDKGKREKIDLPESEKLTPETNWP